MEKIDLAVIGSGIAGISAGIYAKRAGLSFKLFEKNVLGGQLLFVSEIENYIGLPPSKGIDLLRNLEKNLKDLKIAPFYKEIKNVQIKDKEIYLRSGDNLYVSNSLIIATGAAFKKIGLEDDDRFLGKGLSYCAVCDGFFFKGKTVAVLGGGNSACEEAIYLSQICKKVYLIHRRASLRAMDYLQKEIFKKSNIELIWNNRIKTIRGKDYLEELILENTENNEEKELPVKGLFVAIGTKPNTEIFKNIVDMDEKGFILTDEEMHTSVNSVYACGDCRRRALRQLITAAAEGAAAAISAYKYLRGHYISS